MPSFDQALAYCRTDITGTSEYGHFKWSGGKRECHGWQEKNRDDFHGYLFMKDIDNLGFEYLETMIHSLSRRGRLD